MSKEAEISRTDAEVIELTEQFAGLYLREALGFEVPADYRFHQHLDNPRTAKCWDFACKVMEEIYKTDPQDALDNMDEDPTLVERDYMHP